MVKRVGHSVAVEAVHKVSNFYLMYVITVKKI